MHTISGKRFELGTTYAPSIEDVAIGLARIPRWAGATVRPWSVLQHSLAASALAERPQGGRGQLYALWHDCEEMATGDIPTPFKTPDQRELGEELRRWMYEQTLGFPYPNTGIQEAVKRFDDEVRLAELYCLCHPRAWDWSLTERAPQMENFDAADAVWDLIDMPEREAIYAFTTLTKALLSDLGAKVR